MQKKKTYYKTLATFTYYAINSFVSITRKLTLSLPLRLVYFCFNIISSYRIVFCCYLKRFSLFLNVSFRSQVQVFTSEIFWIRRLKYPYSCFSSHFCFVVIVVLFVLIFSVLFQVSNVLFEGSKCSQPCLSAEALINWKSLSKLNY